MEIKKKQNYKRKKSNKKKENRRTRGLEKDRTHYLERPGTQFGGKGTIGAIGGPEAAG